MQIIGQFTAFLLHAFGIVARIKKIICTDIRYLQNIFADQ